MTGQQFAKGGPITGPHSDSIPALLDNGYVLSAREVRELGAGVDALAKLNAANRCDGHQT